MSILFNGATCTSNECVDDTNSEGSKYRKVEVRVRNGLVLLKVNDIPFQKLL